MSRFKLTIEYEGTRYSGWQIQKNSRTVQGELVSALRRALEVKELDLAGSGRTDAGVHALGQVAHLDVRTVLGPEIIRMRANDILPPDINIIEVEKASAGFHSRHDAIGRQYLYQISRRRTALGKRFVWWVKDSLDVSLMRGAATAFSGMKDFRTFTDDDPEEKSTVTKIDEIVIRESGDLVLLRFRGSHFLWKLVRRMVGVIAQAGRGKLPVARVGELLQDESAPASRLTAPPSGLFLEKVYYPGDHVRTDLPPPMSVRHER